MATTTQNLGLIEPAGTDHALVSNINTNSDKIDAEAGNVRGNIALVQNGDTATQAISKDQLVVWKGVLKKATANIASGATLSGSNLSDDTIAAELAALNSNITNLGVTVDKKTFGIWYTGQASNEITVPISSNATRVYLAVCPNGLVVATTDSGGGLGTSPLTIGGTVVARTSGNDLIINVGGYYRRLLLISMFES